MPPIRLVLSKKCQMIENTNIVKEQNIYIKNGVSSSSSKDNPFTLFMNINFAKVIQNICLSFPLL